MIVETVEMGIANNVAVRTVQRDSFTEFYLTGWAEAYSEIADPAAVYGEAATIVAAEGIELISEKIYGRSSAREEILRARKMAFLKEGLDPSLPVTYVDGRPAGGGEFAGLQMWGIAPADRNASVVSTVESETGQSLPGRCWTSQGLRMLYLPYVRGIRPDGELPSCGTSQAEQMFANATALLERQGFSYSQVVRTWIYFPRILDWYGEFNRVRTEHHARMGLGRDLRSSVFPASTGIQGKCHGEECFMDLLALDAGDAGMVSVRPIRSSFRQGQAFAYGSGFSRGLALEIEGKKIVYVSGTASINSAGDTVHVGDPEGQCVETLLNIAALLEAQGGGLEDICTAVVFCKNEETYDAFRMVTRLLRVPPFPAICVVADVCRPDLLVEIEPVALV